MQVLLQILLRTIATTLSGEERVKHHHLEFLAWFFFIQPVLHIGFTASSNGLWQVKEMREQELATPVTEKARQWEVCKIKNCYCYLPWCMN